MSGIIYCIIEDKLLENLEIPLYKAAKSTTILRFPILHHF